MRTISDLYIKTAEVASVMKKLALFTVIGCIAVSPAIVNAQTINTKTTVTDSSGSKTTTGTDDVSKTTGATLKQDVKTDEVKAKKEAAEKAEEKRQEEIKDVNYTGVYNGRQIVPDTMAIYCKTNAEQFLADTSLIDKCLNRYLAAMNNSNASLRSDGVKDYNALLLRLALDAYATALTKTASVANYEDVQNDMADKSRQSQTEREDGAAISNTTSVTTDVINSLRELYAASILVEAVQGLEAVDPSVIDQDVVAEVDAEADKATRDVSDEAAFSVSSEAELKNEEIEDSGVDPDAVAAEENARNEAAAAAKEEAKEEEPIDGGTLQPVTVTGNSPITKLEQMSPAEYAQNKDKIETIKANLIKQMNASDAEDWEIADAQRDLERLAALEKKQAAANAAGEFVGSGNCSAGGEATVCTNGIHKDKYNHEYVCDDGICVLKSIEDAAAASANNTQTQANQPTFDTTFYTYAIKRLSNDKLDEEMRNAKDLMAEYKEYKAAKASGNAWELDPGQEEEWKNAAFKYELLLQEASSRR